MYISCICAEASWSALIGSGGVWSDIFESVLVDGGFFVLLGELELDYSRFRATCSNGKTLLTSTKMQCCQEAGRGTGEVLAFLGAPDAAVGPFLPRVPAAPSRFCSVCNTLCHLVLSDSFAFYKNYITD